MRFMYLPVETKVRELTGKALLAARATSRGWATVIGPRFEIIKILGAGPPGVFVENSISELKVPKLERIRRLGHRVVSICEESTAYPVPEWYCDRLVGPGAGALTDIIFAIGARHAGDIRRIRPDLSSRLNVTGNPRFDALREGFRITQDVRAERIKRLLGAFLLVNTNFSLSNSVGDRQDLLEYQASRGYGQHEEALEFLEAYATYKERQMNELRRLLIDVRSGKLFKRVIVRPHPSENHKDWRDWGKQNGIEVYHDHDAASWMLASEMTLHTGCTTGMEAMVLGRPAATFMIDGSEAQLNPADLVSESVRDEAELRLRVEHKREEWAKGRREVSEERFERLRHYIANADGRLACDGILDALDALAVDEAPLSALPVPELHVRAARLAIALRRRLPRLAARNTPVKLGSITAADLSTLFSQWVGAGKMLAPPRAVPFGRNCWVLMPA